MTDGAGGGGRGDLPPLSQRAELAAARGVIIGALLGALVWAALLLTRL